MIRILMAVVVSLASFSAAADSVESMLQELAIIENNPALHQAALEDGKERATLCVRCHGDDGNSKRDYNDTS